jgi:hypothetical protein
MKIMFFMIGGLVASSVQAQVEAPAIERWPLPDPETMVSATNVLCADQAKAVLVAGALRANGRRREEVLSLVPEAPKNMSLRMVSAMRESVEDAFDFPKLSTYAQYSFRSEVCYRETLGAVRMPRLVAVLTQVEGCQRIHGPDKSNNLFQCIRGVIQGAEPRL